MVCRWWINCRKVALQLRYCRTPPNLPTYCDCCGTKFSIAHGLECKTGGIVIQRQDEIKFEHQGLSARALIPSVVRDEPQIWQVRSAVVEEIQGISTPTGERGDQLNRNIWKRQTDWILDVRITNFDAPSNIHWKPDAVLLSHEREKKKYLQACPDQCCHFSPFVVSCDGVLGNEAKVQLYYNPCRKPHQDIRKVRRITTMSRMRQHPQWEDESGLSLFNHWAAIHNWTKAFTQKHFSARKLLVYH